jgi:hypothetical protein
MEQTDNSYELACLLHSTALDTVPDFTQLEKFQFPSEVTNQTALDRLSYRQQQMGRIYNSLKACVNLNYV